MKLYLIIVSALISNLFLNAQDITLSGATNCGATAISGSWEVPCGVTEITVEVYGAGGGGGGGGGGSMGGVCPTYGAGGGGGGGYTSITINVTQGTIFNYSVGSGGCGGSNGGDLSNGGHGNAGGNSSFNGTDAGGNAINLIANGGARGNRGNGCNVFGGGGGSGTGGAGGTASGGSTNTSGSPGGNGVERTSSMPSNVVGGTGGNGAGPAGGIGGPETSIPGTTYGGGGAGGGDSNGAAGAEGVIFITLVSTSATVPTPTVTTTPANCIDDGESTISNYDASFTYTFSPTGPTVASGGIISGMTLNIPYTVIATEAGCDSQPSAEFSNQAATGVPSTPTITSTSSTCTSASTSEISNYDINLNYIFNPLGPTVDAGGNISGMTTGTSYTIIANDGVCDSDPSAAFSNQPALSLPAMPIVVTNPPTCISGSTSEISNYDANLNYVFNPLGPSVGAGGVINGMTAGTSYTVFASDGVCDSDSSAEFSNQAATGVPSTPTITSTSSTCTSASTSEISNYDVNLNYIFSPPGPTVGVGGIINGMTIGTSYTVIANDGVCDSDPSVPFSNQTTSNPNEMDITFSTNQPSCFGGNDGSLTATVNAGGTPPFQFTWDSNANNQVGETASNLEPGSYVVTVEDANGCIQTASTTMGDPAELLIENIEVINFACFDSNDGAVNISTIGGTGIITFEISEGSSLLASNQTGQFTENFLAGTYTVSITDANGCEVSDLFTITQPPPLELLIDDFSDPSCFGSSDGSITVIAQNGEAPYTYELSDGTKPTTGGVFILENGIHEITVTDANGCTATANQTLQNPSPIFVDIVADTTSVEMGESLNLEAVAENTTGNIVYEWSPDDGLSCTDCQNPTAVLYQSQDVFVTVTDELGCSRETSIFIEVIENLRYFIPNAFTPGNADGTNDDFRVYGENIQHIEMMIFNRWGEKIFEAASPFVTWDGTFKGELQQSGVYSYFAKIKFLNGRSIEDKGSITLIK